MKGIHFLMTFIIVSLFFLALPFWNKTLQNFLEKTERRGGHDTLIKMDVDARKKNSLILLRNREKYPLKG
ncbi:MAG: hypothetical protein Ct9H90mP27_5500 [Gammaproteobacteria bacterium]|nr:MAG: hypothetical protein Ct9H90mP27_5500 [Gammaproteobacteria bacterium]